MEASRPSPPRQAFSQTTHTSCVWPALWVWLWCGIIPLATVLTHVSTAHACLLCAGAGPREKRCTNQAGRLSSLMALVIISLSSLKLKFTRKLQSQRLSPLDKGLLLLYVDCTAPQVLTSGDSSFLCWGLSHQNREQGESPVGSYYRWGSGAKVGA